MTKQFSLFIIALAMAAATAPAAAADVRLDSYRHPQNENFRIFNQMYLDGVKGGLMSYNAFIKTHGGQPAFCLPDNFALTTEQTEEIMLKAADKRGAKGEMLVALLLMAGLRDSFPCEKAGGRSADKP